MITPDKLSLYCLSLQPSSHIWGSIFYSCQPHSGSDWDWLLVGLPSNSSEAPPILSLSKYGLLWPLGTHSLPRIYEKVPTPVIHTKVWGATFLTISKKDMNLAIYLMFTNSIVPSISLMLHEALYNPQWAQCSWGLGNLRQVAWPLWASEPQVLDEFYGDNDNVKELVWGLNYIPDERNISSILSSLSLLWGRLLTGLGWR